MATGANEDQRISIRRYDPETDSEPRWVDYTVPSGERTTVLEALAYIYENIDPTLAFRFGCRFDSCGLCAVELNGRPKMACFRQTRGRHEDRAPGPDAGAARSGDRPGQRSSKD